MYLSPLFILSSQQTPRASSPLTIPISKRSMVHRADGTVDVPHLRRALKRTVENIERGFHAYERNTGTTHNLARNMKRTEKRDVGSEVHLTNYNNDIWYGPVDGHSLYNTSESSTSQDTKKKFSTQLDGIEISGEEYTDSVTLAGYTVTNQTLGAATHYPPSLQGTTNFPPDGILGMAFPSISVFNSSPVFQTIVSQHKVSDQVFGFFLASPGPELMIGGVNTELFSDPIIWFATEQAHWGSHFDNIQINQDIILNKTTDMIVSTGTTQLIGDTDSVRIIYNNITGSRYAGGGIWTVPCDFTYQISIRFHGNDTFNIPPEKFKLGPYGNSPNTCVAFWVIGDVFLSNVRFGFASLP
ncbi:aspartic peptidase domain-containing protein [Lactifluus volemus]|nr:aspartic peptidase domain-containing protein [Lactifluus volemus]